VKRRARVLASIQAYSERKMFWTDHDAESQTERRGEEGIVVLDPKMPFAGNKLDDQIHTYYAGADDASYAMVRT